MPTELKLTGFAELERDLTAFPTMARDDIGRPILSAAADRAKAALLAAYPSVTGNLRAGVAIIQRVGRGIAAVMTLTSASPHAHLYEFGTVHQRPRPTFLPITGRERRDATMDVAAAVRAQGLDVRGDRD